MILFSELHQSEFIITVQIKPYNESRNQLAVQYTLRVGIIAVKQKKRISSFIKIFTKCFYFVHFKFHTFSENCFLNIVAMNASWIIVLSISSAQMSIENHITFDMC